MEYASHQSSRRRAVEVVGKGPVRATGRLLHMPAVFDAVVNKSDEPSGNQDTRIC